MVVCGGAIGNIWQVISRKKTEIEKKNGWNVSGNSKEYREPRNSRPCKVGKVILDTNPSKEALSVNKMGSSLK